MSTDVLGSFQPHPFPQHCWLRVLASHLDVTLNILLSCIFILYLLPPSHAPESPSCPRYHKSAIQQYPVAPEFFCFFCFFF